MIMRKLKALVTGERADVATGEIVEVPGRYEKVDPVPMAPPVGFKREPTLMEKIQLMMLKERVSRLQAELGAETPEEAEDFDVGDEDQDPTSLYEFDRHEVELLERVAKAQERHAQLSAKYPKHDFGPVPFVDEFPVDRGVRGTSPAGGAPAPVPGPAPAGPSEVPPVLPNGNK